MTHTIFEVLSGEYIDGTRIDSVPEEMEDAHSIVSHLSRLLNARAGVLKHLPDYGLPDIAEVYQGLPYSIDSLIENIVTIIKKYEPRLANVEVFYRPVEDFDAILRLEISGTAVNGKLLRFETYFLSGGYAQVEQKKKFT